MNRPCLEPGCRFYATYRGRCELCNRNHDKSIRRAGRAHYRTKAWKLTRRQVLFDEPICRSCAAEGKDTLAEEVDHIDGNPFNNERSNLQPLCSSHHGRKTRAEQRTPR